MACLASLEKWGMSRLLGIKRKELSCCFSQVRSISTYNARLLVSGKNQLLGFLLRSSGSDFFRKSSGIMNSCCAFSSEQRNVSVMEGSRVWHIALTGGPCGGKSTALSIISHRLNSLGFRVFLVHEVASLLISGGAKIEKDNEQNFLCFEANLMKTQLALENAFLDIAKGSGFKSIVVSDRGTMDVKAYMSDHLWNQMLEQNGWTETELRDRRYDAVIHLVTAALGAEKFYTIENNSARTETISQARNIDYEIRGCWTGHPRLKIIDNNTTSFEEKVKRVIDTVCAVVGLPVVSGLRRKFLVDPSSYFCSFPVRYEEFFTETMFLMKDDPTEEARLVKRTQRNSFTYHLSRRYTRPIEEKATEKRQISGREFASLQKQRDPSRLLVKKRVKVFVYESQYYELSQFLEPVPGLCLLDTEVEKGEQLKLPPFIQVEREVTFDPYYQSAELSKMKS